MTTYTTQHRTAMRMVTKAAYETDCTQRVIREAFRSIGWVLAEFNRPRKFRHSNRGAS